MVSNAEIKQGDVVKMHNWHGVVLETHYDEAGELTILKVQTARNLFRGYGPEYIDTRLDREAVTPAPLSALQEEIEMHRGMLEGAVQRMLAMVESDTAVIPQPHMVSSEL